MRQLPAHLDTQSAVRPTAKLPQMWGARMNWEQRAACKGHPDPEIFHPKPSNTRGIQQAKAICARCPVRNQCLTQAMEYGIWGGLTEDERRELAGPGPVTLKLDLPVRSCVRCGQEFKPGHKLRKYCSRRCGDQLRQAQRPSRAKPPATRQCLGCGQEFTAQSSNHRYCTPACSMRERNRNRRRKRQVIHTPRPCAECGTRFTPDRRAQRFCNRKCTGVFHQRAWRERRANNEAQGTRKARAS